MRRKVLLGLLASVVALGCAPDNRKELGAEPLHIAMHQLSTVIMYDILSPPQSSRVYAYASIAAYEAARSGYKPEYRTLAGQLNGLTAVPEPKAGVQYYLPLSSVHAFMTVGKALTFSNARMDSMRITLDDSYRHSGIPAPVVDSSIAYGDRVAKHILAWARSDHFLQTRGMPKYTVMSKPERWIPTPPAYMDAIEPTWSKVRPFVMDSSAEFRPEPPPVFDMTPGTPFFRQVKEVYDIQKKLTDEQREMAVFWDNNPYTMHVQGHAMYATKKISPGGHWMGIAGIAAKKANASLMQSADAYARTSIALADGFIAVWEEKYRSNLVRPETVINLYLDDKWEPLLQTPPFPEYMSGHSVVSTAAAVVLTNQFGNGFRFDDDVEHEYGLPVRTFSSFEQAAAEAAISRLYGGIHYRVAVEEGVVQGRKVGNLVVARIKTRTVGARLTPIKSQ